MRAWLRCILVLGVMMGGVALGSQYAGAAIYICNEDGVSRFTNMPTSRDCKFYRNETAVRPPPRKTEGAAVPSGPVGEIVSQCASQFNLDEALIHAVIKAESGYNPRAVSNKGAMGIMQLIPSTARDMQVNDPFNPEDNIRGGSRYLRLMLDEFGGNLDLAIAAYNAGPNAVRRHGGIPPYQETRTYVDRVKRFLQSFRDSKDTNL